MTLTGDSASLTMGLFEVSRAAGATVTSAGAALGEQAASPGEAVRRAARASVRSAVILLPHEIGSALGEISLAAASHAPLVVHVPVAAGDDLSALGPLCQTGAAVISTWSAAEASTAAIALQRAAHDSEMPCVHIADAPSNIETLPLMSPTAIEAVLGAFHPRAADVVPDRARVRGFASRVPFALAASLRAAAEHTGTPVSLLERFETADAEEVVVTFGRTFPIACGVARAHRSRGRKVGVLGVRALRPFLAADVVKAISRAKTAVVVEPMDAPLSPSGLLAESVKGAFFDALTWAPGFPGVGRVPPVVSVTSARPVLGAADVELAIAELSGGERARRVIVLGSE
ncbi:MAG: transketolase [Polyangiaceae bacterium]|nr:transketolase [Polyangiaceae bacterium]